MRSIGRSAFLTRLLPRLQRLVPLELADSSWDNVGLLCESLREPSAGRTPRMLLCIDLTARVLREAVAEGVDVVLAYHPPWFIKARSMTTENLPVLAGAAHHGISVYCVHTALDAMDGGINDALLGLLGQASGVEPVDADTRMGRIGTLQRPLTLREAVEAIKAGLGLKSVRVAPGAPDRTISTAAVCAGSGSSVLQRVRSTDLLVTGEMSHHDVLAAVQRGTHVILCEHTNTERFFLPQLKRLLDGDAELDVDVLISREDCDPIEIW